MIYSVGEILVDEFVSENKKDRFPGGAPFNVASNIRKYTENVGFYGSLGKDENGFFLQEVAKKKKFKKLILNFPKGRDTTIALVTLTKGERSFKFLRENGADFFLSFAKFKKLNIQKGDIVHIGSLMLSHAKGRSFMNKAINYVKEKGALVSFDVNYRDDIFSSSIQAKHIYKKILAQADIVKLSTDELKDLSKFKTLKKQLAELVTPNQMVFVSKGSEGSSFYYHDFVAEAKSIKVSPIDTTGAGDAFYSFVLYSLDGNLDKVEDAKFMKDLLFKSNVVGACATLKKGAIDVIPSLEEITSYCKSN